MKLNEQQQMAVDAIHADMATGKPVIVLWGFAGTGKTTLLNLIAHQVNCDVDLMAPTNKAALVLNEKTGMSASTVHHAIYTVDDKNGTFLLDGTKLGRKGLIICDEASMMNQKLIEDLLNIAHTKKNTVLFVGDSFQLPPVSSKENIFSMFEPTAKLTQVMRQEDGSKILDYATALRNVQKTFIPDMSNDDITVARYQDCAKQYLAAVKNGEDATMVVWTNDLRVKMNHWMRKSIYNNEIDIPQDNDMMMAIGTSSVYANGETFKAGHLDLVQEVDLEISDFGKPKSVEHAYCMTDDEGKMYIVFPYTKKASIPRQSISNVKSLPKDFYDIDKKGRYKINCDVSIVTYGYAITAHKAQGSQWDTVYVYECSTIPENAAQWLYTAVTRAAKKLIIRDGIAERMSWNKIQEAI